MNVLQLSGSFWAAKVVQKNGMCKEKGKICMNFGRKNEGKCKKMQGKCKKMQGKCKKAADSIRLKTKKKVV